MSDINDLARQFSIPGVVRLEPGHGRLPRLAITTDKAEAHIYLHGAHVTHFRPRGEDDVLFLSEKSNFEPGKAIRGGVPVIFPWFGPKAGDAAAPAHGFGRTTEWELVSVRPASDGNVVARFELGASNATRKQWPGDFRLRYTITIGAVLELTLEVLNVSNAPFTFEEALHTYLCVDDVRAVGVNGLAGRQYLDKTDGMKRKTQGGDPMKLVAETDRTFVNTSDVVVVDDPGLSRQLTVDKQQSLSTVVWNPWIAKAKALSDFGDDEWPHMLCIETANAADNAVTLAAGQSHRMVARISAGPRPQKGAPARQWEMSYNRAGDQVSR